MDLREKLSDISKKVSGGVVDTYKVVSDKTGEIVNETKNRFLISSKNDDIKDLYLEIGRETYELYLNNEELNSEFTKKCKKIHKTFNEIEEIEKLILFNKELRTCSNCDKVIALNSSYCEFCGEKQSKAKVKNLAVQDRDNDKKEEKVKEKVCPECGKVLNSEVIFCNECGRKF